VYCYTCRVEFNKEITISHLRGVEHMSKQLALDERMRKLGQAVVNQGQTGNPSSQHPAHQVATNAPNTQHMMNCPCCSTLAYAYSSPTVSTLTEQLMQIMSQGTTMPAPQMMPVPPPTQTQSIMRSMEEAVARMKTEQGKAVASKTATSSQSTFKNQEPKFQGVKLIVKDIDANGTAVPGTRVDLANCRDLYCALCDVWMASKERMEAHIQGEEHGKKEKDAK
jgi:hypothetical protein